MIVEQAAAIPYRVEDGELLVALITARSDGRWVVPKGSIEPGEAPHEAAVRETEEEAGLIVDPDAPEVGRWRIRKVSRECVVRVFAMPVLEELDDWDEADVRARRWATPHEAASLVREPAVQRMLHRLEHHLLKAA